MLCFFIYQNKFSYSIFLTYLPTLTHNKQTMDFVNKLAGGAQNQGQSANEQVMQDKNSGSSQGGGFLGGIGNKLNEAAGGGRESEKNEDYLDKGT